MKDEFALHHGRSGSDGHKSLFEILHRHTESAESLPIDRTSPVIPVDVKEDESGVTVFADLPGVDEDEIHIDLEANILMISTEREFDHDNEDPDEYVVLERSYGPIKRAINVPGFLDKGGMTAKYKRGVLKVRIPKVRKVVSA